MNSATCGRLQRLPSASRVHIACCALFFLNACNATLERRLTAHDADRMIAKLHEHHIAATKHAEPASGNPPRYAVRVLNDDVANALPVLRELLNDHGHAGMEALLAKPSMVPTPMEERARLAAATAVELERTLRLWDGTLDARVHITPAANNHQAIGSNTPARAAVVIKHVSGQAPAVVTIRQLVADASTGLNAEDVTVIRLEAAATAIQPLVQLGPFAVTQSSAGWLRLWLTASLVLNAAMAGWLGLRRWRRQRSRMLASSTDATQD